MILFITTRLEFGRDDLLIDFRRREVNKWNAKGEVKLRMKEWIEFIIKYYYIKNISIVANNLYDAEYVYYHTGKYLIFYELFFKFLY